MMSFLLSCSGNDQPHTGYTRAHTATGRSISRARFCTLDESITAVHPWPVACSTCGRSSNRPLHSACHSLAAVEASAGRTPLLLLSTNPKNSLEACCTNVSGCV
jgi:hypothetical protein